MDNIIVAEFDQEERIHFNENHPTNVKPSTTKKKPPKRLITDGKKPAKVVLNECIKKTSTDKQNLILQKKSIVFNVYSFFKKLAANPRKLNFNQAQLLTAEACGISLASVKRVTRSYCIVERLEDDDVGTSEETNSGHFDELVETLMEGEPEGHFLTKEIYVDEIRGDNVVVIENSNDIEDVPCSN